MKKQILSLFLCSCMLLSILPTPAVALGEPLRRYDPMRTDTMVLPGILWNNRQFMLGADLRHSQANYINLPQMDDQEGDIALDSATVYKDFETNGAQSMDLGDTIATNTNAGVRYVYGARGKGGVGKSNTVQPYTDLTVNESWPPISSHNSKKFIDMGLYRSGSTSPYLTGRTLSFKAQTFEHHWWTRATQMKDLVLYLIDDRPPHFTHCDITYTDAEGNTTAAQNVKSGTKLTFTLHFSEYIRFADDDGNRSPRLQFELSANGKDLLTQYADFQTLSGTQMKFTYTVPQTYGSVSEMYQGVNSFTIHRIVPLDSSRDFSGTFTLKLLPEAIAGTMKADPIQVDNLLTDLAGNPISNRDIWISTGPVRFDLAPPEVESVALERSPNAVDENNKIIPYVRAGDSIRCVMTFNEPIAAKAGTISAVLNLKDSSGENLKVTNSTDVEGQTVRFDPVAVTEDMYKEGGGRQMLSVLSVDASAVLDTAGWPGQVQDLEAEQRYPIREWQLDTLPPLVETPLDGDRIVPQTSQFQDPTVFCIPINIRDDDSRSPQIEVSGTNGLYASFYLMGFPENAKILRDGATVFTEEQDYAYYVSTSGALTETELEQRWIPMVNHLFCEIQKIPLPQYTSEETYGSYLYFKIPNSEIQKLRLAVEARDQAGNVNRCVRFIDYTLDLTPPVLTDFSEPVLQAEGADTFSLSQQVTFRDPSGIDPYSVRVSAVDGSFSEVTPDHSSGVVHVTLTSSDDTSATFTLTVSGLRKGDTLDTAAVWTVEDGSSSSNPFTSQPIPLRYSLKTACIIVDTSPENQSGYIDALDLSVWREIQIPHATANTTTIAMIQDPGNPSGYAVREVRQNAFNGSLIQGGQYLNWEYYEEAAGESPNGILLQPADGDLGFMAQYAGDIGDKSQGYTATVSYKLISGEGITLEQLTGTDPIDTPIEIGEFTRHLVRIGSSDDLTMDFTVTPVDWEFEPDISDVGMPQAGDIGLPSVAPRTVGGRQVRIQLTLPHEPSWSLPLSWSDVVKTSLEIVDNDSGERLCEIPLALTDQEQLVTIPAAFQPEVEGSQTFDFYVSTRYKFQTTAQRMDEFAAGGGTGASFKLYGHRGSDYMVGFQCRNRIIDPETKKEYATVLHKRVYGSELETAQELGSTQVIPVTVNPDAGVWTGKFIFDNPPLRNTPLAIACPNYVRIWNATDPNQEAANQAAALWMYFTTFGESDFSGKTEYPALEFFQEGLNTVRYQCFNRIDGLSEPRTLLFDASFTLPELELNLLPDAAEGLAKSRSVQIERARDRLGNPLTVMHHDGQAFTELPEQLAIQDPDTHVFYAADDYGGLKSLFLKAEKLDNDKPVIKDMKVGTSSDGNALLRFTLEDAFIDADTLPDCLRFRYDDAYTEKLKPYGLRTDSEGWFRIPGETSDQGFAPDAVPGLVSFGFTRRNENRLADVTLELIAPKDSGGYNGSLSLSYTDSVGNVSDPMTSPELNIRPVELTGELFYEGAGGEQNCPTDPIFYPALGVQLSAPAVPVELDHREVGNRAGFRFPGERTPWVGALPIYTSGSYTLNLRDAFGDIWPLSFTVPEDAFFGDDLELSYPSAGENGQNGCQVRIRSLSGNPFQIELPTAEDYAYREDGIPHLPPHLTSGEASIRLPDGTRGSFGEFYTEVTLHVTKNGLFKVLIKNDAGNLTERLVSVLGNREPAELEQIWDYPNGLHTDAEGNTYTEGYATVTVEAKDPSRSVVGSNTYTFSPADPVGTVKLLNITDDQGNVQEYPVTLTAEIRKSAARYTDPPDLSITLFGERNGRIETVGFLDAADADHTHKDLADLYGPAVKFQISTSTTTPNRVKTVLLPLAGDASQLEYASAQNAVIDGVSISDNFLTVTESTAAFSLILIDEYNEKSPRMDFDGGFSIDHTPPTVRDVQKEALGYGGVKLSLEVTDDHSSFADIQVVSPGNVTRENGKFVYTATDNGNLTFVFRDRCGNLVTHTVEITGIDRNIPAATLTAYTPYGQGSQTTPPARTNREITAHISFDKIIRTMSLSIREGDKTRPITPDDGVTLIREGSQAARVVFTKDASVSLQYTDLSGLSGIPMVLEIPTGTIDPDPPEIRLSVTELRRADAASPYAARITAYAPGETVYHGARAVTEEDPMDVTVFENRVYAYTFTDEAGNITAVEAEVQTLDTTPLEVFLGAYQPHENGGSFVLRTNKPVTVKLPEGLTGGTEISEKDGGELLITAAKNGFYTISVTDRAGNRKLCQAVAGSGDTEAPVILTESSYVYLRQGSKLSPEALDELLMSGLKVYDHVTAEADLRLELNKEELPPAFDRADSYPYTVTAVDEAGNKTTRERYLTVFPGELTTVLVNGAFAKHTGVISTTKGTYPILVSLPEASVTGPAFEPYQVYCTKGFYTVGEMKPYMEPLPAAGTKTGSSDQYSYHFSENGWYTIYVLRQDREVFLTHLLIQ